MNLTEKKRLLHIAEAAALLAGERLKNRRKEWRRIQTVSIHDIKIQADRESEEIILESLAVSQIPCFSEETGSVNVEKEADRRNKKTNLVWIIDPLDGTLNYYQGIPLSCVSIALYNGLQPILGTIFDFNHGDLFSGIIGKGAWHNHKLIRPSSVSQTSKAVLGTGFPVNSNFSTTALSCFIEEIQKFRKVRLFGSAALSLCYVAAGRIDSYTEERIMFWDVAAGLVLVEAAGGIVQVTNIENPGSAVNVVASNGYLKMEAHKDFDPLTGS